MSQQWNDDLKAQAKALYLADGSRLAAEVTGIPQRTVQRWAMAQGWGTSSDDATGQAADQPVTPVTAHGNGAVAVAKGDGATAPIIVGTNPTRELAQDLALAREVYRGEVAKLREGRGRASAVRDAAVSLGILVDKAGRAEVPGVAGGASFSWAVNHAQAVANLPKLREMVAFLKERALARQRDDDGDG